MPHPRAERTAGVALLTAERRKHATYPELRLGGDKGCASWSRGPGGAGTRMSLFVSSSVSALSGRLPPSLLSVAVQHAIGGAALGAPWLSRAAVGQEPPLDQVLALAEPIGPSRLPMR